MKFKNTVCRNSTMVCSYVSGTLLHNNNSLDSQSKDTPAELLRTLKEIKVLYSGDLI